MTWLDKHESLKSDDVAAAFAEGGGMIGQSPRMLRLGRLLAKIAPRRHPVLVLGEDGAGKETVARLIHAQGLSPERPFVAVDCSAATLSLFETDMLGHSSRSFGKSKERLADVVGTIFLNEIWALSPELQARLVRALQEREIRSASEARIARDARIVASSSRDLELAVQQGTFRRDLYLRLNLSSVRVPPLRDRKEDIDPLVDHFLASVANEKGPRRSLSPDARNLLVSYDWPGNVRELRESVERAAEVASGPILEIEDFPPHLQRTEPGLPVRRVLNLGPNIVPLAEVERQTILNALERLNGNKLMTARALGIGKTTLYRKLKEYGICAPVMGRPVGQR
ncbi:MAG TPA: sigma 54-interacting transcriptional regulator [Candidatus Angelobacter sp.]|nr:sigma 54-interacting transcriptional regulator [Candidatus Angelobacter sp.]